MAQLRDELAASRLVTTADADAAIQLCGDPAFRFTSPATIATWGNRPA